MSSLVDGKFLKCLVKVFGTQAYKVIRVQVWASLDVKYFGPISVFFVVADCIFPKLTSLFRASIFFLHRSGQCASAREGFIASGRQDVENGRRQVS